MNFKLFSIVLLSVLMISVASACYPRTVSGTVTDSSGNPVPNANIEVKCYGRMINNTAFTDSSGKYLIKTDSDKCLDYKQVQVTASIDSNSAKDHKKMKAPGIIINLVLENYQVPEFSTITALAALIGSGAGFLVLRRKA